jgi:hypothetical protein
MKGLNRMTELEKRVLSLEAEMKCVKARQVIQEQRAIHEAEIDATREENI